MSRPIKSVWLFLLGLLGLHAGSAQAAQTFVLCAGDAQGESTKVAGCIDVLAWSWGASGTGSVIAGTSLQDISVTKYMDSASEDLLRLLVTRTPLKGTVEFRAYRDVCGVSCPTDPYLTFRINGVKVSSLSTGGSGGEDKLTENVTLEFTEYSYCYRRLNGNLLDPAQCTAFNKTTGAIAPF